MNRLLKRLIVFVLMLAFTLPNVVMAADVPTVKLDISEQAKTVNEQMKVKLSLSNDVPANADFEVNYDQNILEVIDDGLNELSNKLDTTNADKSTAGVIKYTDIQNEGVVITFKVKAEGETEITSKVTDMYVIDRNDKATPEELSTMTASVKTGVKKAEVPKDNDKQNLNKNTDSKNKDSKNNDKPVEKKGFIGQFFDKINSDWVLKILFIAICIIILILLILLIEYGIVSKRNKKKVKEEDYDLRIKNTKQTEDDTLRVRPNRETLQSPRIERERADRNPVRRPLTEEERRIRAARLRRMAENGEIPRPRRPLTEEQRRQIRERRLRREQSENSNGERQVRRPVRRQRNDD